MRREGTDPNNVKMSDVLCDFCRAEWILEEPFVEGHLGSVICGRCLSEAYRRVVLQGAGAPGRCVMCQEQREEPGWSSPTHSASICRRCIKLAAGAVGKDPDFNWQRPTDPGSPDPGNPAPAGPAGG